MKRFISFFAVLFAGGLLANLAAVSAQAGEYPYVVRGNQHLLIGITLDEAAVRAALPAGLEPADGITGGLNVYTSKGGEGVAAYERSYVWVDLKGYESVNGTKARYVLWAATSTGPDKLKMAGLPEVKGQTMLKKDGNSVSGTTTINGKTVMTTAIMLNEGPKCGPSTGSVNYPCLPKADGKLMITQYTAHLTGCAAKPVSANIMVDPAHPLAKFKPTKLIWAAFAPELSFSGSPLLPIKAAKQ